MKKALQFLVFTAILSVAAFQTQAQNVEPGKVYNILNRWKEGLPLCTIIGATQHQVLVKEMEYCFGEWIFEKIPNTNYYKIRETNRETQEYLYVETGKIKFGPIKPGWLTAQWEIVPVGSYVRLKNVRSGKFLHIEKGSVEVGFLIEGGMWSAQWTLQEL